MKLRLKLFGDLQISVTYYNKLSLGDLLVFANSGTEIPDIYLIMRILNFRRFYEIGTFNTLHVKLKMFFAKLDFLFCHQENRLSLVVSSNMSVSQSTWRYVEYAMVEKLKKLRKQNNS